MAENRKKAIKTTARIQNIISPFHRSAAPKPRPSLPLKGKP
jgi:hypothetical protein